LKDCRVAATKLLSSVLCFLSSATYADEVARPAYIPIPPPAVSSSNLVQIILSLFLVLVAIVLVAWLLKRMNMAQQGSVKLIKVLGAVPIGQRERIVLVEVKDTWLVVGVGPGQIRTLHSFQKTEDLANNFQVAEDQASGNKFANLLSSLLNNSRNRKQSATEK
jgi:flagellar protein FliO/FliZ